MNKELKDILDIHKVKKSTKNINDLSVTLKKSKTKGSGLYASKNIKKNTVISYYKMKVFNDNKYKSPTKDMYQFSVYNKNGRENKTLVADLYEGSIEKPFRGKPFWAFFSNEPGPGQTENSHIYEDSAKNYRNRNKLKEGDTVIYKLVSTRNILKGEEIVWCYGDNYIRDYEVESC